MSKFNFNIDIEDNEQQNSLTKSTYNSVTQKQLLDLKDYVVNLGLPSGTLWAKYNLGCDYDLLNNHIEDAKPKDLHGDYYAWGELKPNKHLDRYGSYDSETYRFYDCIDLEILKYNDNDNLTQLLSEDDAAYQNMHYKDYKFHIPTKKQLYELIENTNSEYIENYEVNEKEIIGLNGRIFRGTNGNELFIPYNYIIRAHNSTMHFKGPYIWSSTVYKWDHNNAWHLDFEGGKEGMTTQARYCGMPIRPAVNL